MCIGIAEGLNYLHTGMEDRKMLIHCDIKSDNILLGENREAKIADFGLSKFQHAITINTMHLAGTPNYWDPEYLKTGKLKKASDIYSFGVVLLEIFSGKLAWDSRFNLENEKGKLIQMLDLKLIKDVCELSFTRKEKPADDSLAVFETIACKCLAKTQAERPTIGEVMKELTKALYIQENTMKPLKISREHITFSVENFTNDNSIMRGCEMLYKGTVKYNNRRLDQEVHVKQFSTTSQEDGFLKEFEVLYKYRQENIIGLVGYCKENLEKIIVYEHASKGQLTRYLKDTSFPWITRLKVCIDVANGLKFLHGGDGGQDVVIHNDLKSSNILLTNDWKEKICGFEHALTHPANTEIKYLMNDVVGSLG
ncbi:receptor-like protein kinase THESEUS 1 [Bidens hawaiensis]|uniref:receptor-like protein kinase THESEUS 1 n=1 Tax=Bidens hawaiensis TaxID=980011 RepID=UPI004048ED0F